MSLPRAMIAGAFCLALSARVAGAEPAVTGTKLNLRAGPGPAFGVIVVMPPGTKVDVQKCHRTWCRVKQGRRVGYTSRAFLRIGSEAFASAGTAAAPPEPAPPPAAVRASSGPRIWRWRDPDWRNRHWRRFGWRNRFAAP